MTDDCCLTVKKEDRKINNPNTRKIINGMSIVKYNLVKKITVKLQKNFRFVIRLVFNYEKMGLALISSFSAFIAFDRLFNSKNLIKFNPKKHRDLLVKVYEKDSKYNGQDNYLVNKIKSNVNLEKPDDN